MIIRKLEALFTINTNAAQFQKAAVQLDHLAEKTQAVMNAIAGYWAVQALQNFVINTSNAMAQLGTTSQYLGITAQALQELRYAAEKSGVKIDALDDSLKELQVRAFDAKSGEGEAAEAFQTLGVKATNAAGRIREPLELLDEVADKFMKLPTQSDRLWVADAVFGDEGATVLKMLQHGSKGLHEMRKEARALGITLEQGTIAKAAELNAHLAQLRATSKGMANTFVSSLLPGLTWIAKRCAALSAAFNQVEHRASLVRVSLIALSAAAAGIVAKLLVVFAPFLLKLALIGAAVSGIALLIEDLWVGFKGGDSVLVNLHKKLRAFFEPIERWVIDLPRRFIESIGLMAKGIADLVPDFVKKGFLTTVQQVVPKDVATYGPQPAKSRWAPAPHAINQNRLTNNHTVNVAVDVKYHADPREIGGEISKAVRKELERERFNAFMGINQYAG